MRQKIRQIEDDFDDHADAAVQRGAHCPMPNEAHPGLHSRPLDATIRQVLTSHRRGSRLGLFILVKNTKC